MKAIQLICKKNAIINFKTDGIFSTFSNIVVNMLLKEGEIYNFGIINGYLNISKDGFIWYRLNLYEKENVVTIRKEIIDAYNDYFDNGYNNIKYLFELENIVVKTEGEK
jgi:hypothetical protein